MYEFKWTLPFDAKQTVTLRITSKSSWLGRKTLRLDDRVVYRRGRMEGIEHRFRVPTGGQELRLTWEQMPGFPSWRPVLLYNEAELEEITGCQPPLVSQRPPFLAVVTGVTYLLMFMMAIMLPHIWRMLYAGLAHSDSRTIILNVDGVEGGAGLLLRGHPLPEATVGQPFEAVLSVQGGRPPYTWKLVKAPLPDGLSFDAETATVSGTPQRVGDKIMGVCVTDASGDKAERPYVISVRPTGRREPRLVTSTLPPAQTGQGYSAGLEVEGGEPPYDWVVNKRKLPKDLSFDRKTGRLTGVVRADVKGVFPLHFGVNDSAYSPYHNIAPWLVPFVATAGCLLGYWNMRRWGVILYGALILGQLGVGGMTEYPLSWIAIVLQVLVFLVGAGYFKRMQ